MPGGEALARQIVHGKRFFLEELGVETEEIWLPDSFGYTAAFPQLARLAGAKWFLTQKLSWNQTDKMPHHTFWWEGIDGTRVFTHFPPVDTYNSQSPRRRTRPRGTQLRRQGARHPLAGAVRLGRRRGRSDPRDAGAGPPDALPGGLAARSRSSRRPGSSRPPTRSTGPRRRSGRASCTSSSTAARTPRRRRPSRATGAVNICCARRSCGPRRRRCGRANGGYAYPYDDPGPPLEDRAAAPVPRHPARVVHRLGPPGGPRHLCGGRGGADRADRRRRSRRWGRRRGGGRRRGPTVLQRLALRPGRDRERCRRRGGPDEPTRVAVHVPALGRRPSSAPARTPHAPPPVRAESDGAAPSPSTTGCCGCTSTPTDCWPPSAICTAGREVLAPGARGNLLQLHPDHPNKYDAWDLDRHYRHRHTDLTDAESVELADGRAAVRDGAGDQGVRRVPDHPGADAAGGLAAPRHRHRHRLARVGEGPQGRLPAGCPRRTVHLRGAVRARAPPHPHQHQLGRGPFRDLRAPLAAGRRAGLRHRTAQRLDVRPRRHPAPARPRDWARRSG